MLGECDRVGFEGAAGKLDPDAAPEGRGPRHRFRDHVVGRRQSRVELEQPLGEQFLTRDRPIRAAIARRGDRGQIVREHVPLHVAAHARPRRRPRPSRRGCPRACGRRPQRRSAISVRLRFPRASRTAAMHARPAASVANADDSGGSAGRSSADTSSDAPGGATHDRPSRPRPAVCSSATATTPSGAPRRPPRAGTGWSSRSWRTSGRR